MSPEFLAWWEREGCRIVGDPVDYAGAAFEAGRRAGPARKTLRPLGETVAALVDSINREQVLSAPRTARNDGGPTEKCANHATCGGWAREYDSIRKRWVCVPCFLGDSEAEQMRGQPALLHDSVEEAFREIASHIKCIRHPERPGTEFDYDNEEWLCAECMEQVAHSISLSDQE